MEFTQMCSEDITELAKAMLKVQSMLQPAIKDRNNSFTKSDYATLKSVMDVCRQPLIENGIWLTQYPVPVEPGYLGLITKLTHADTGQWQASLAVMPLPKGDPQGYGSAMTYARRYALSALVGIVTEVDDDGNGARAAGTAQKQCQPPRPRNTKNAPPLAAPEPITENPALASLPKLDGVTYKLIQGKTGQTCIQATGKTQAKAPMLQAAGFVFHKQRKIWWRFADAA